MSVAHVLCLVTRGTKQKAKAAGQVCVFDIIFLVVNYGSVSATVIYWLERCAS